MSPGCYSQASNKACPLLEFGHSVGSDNEPEKTRLSINKIQSCDPWSLAASHGWTSQFIGKIKLKVLILSLKEAGKFESHFEPGQLRLGGWSELKLKQSHQSKLQHVRQPAFSQLYFVLLTLLEAFRWSWWSLHSWVWFGKTELPRGEHCMGPTIFGFNNTLDPTLHPRAVVS